MGDARISCRADDGAGWRDETTGTPEDTIIDTQALTKHFGEALTDAGA